MAPIIIKIKFLINLWETGHLGWCNGKQAKVANFHE